MNHGVFNVVRDRRSIRHYTAEDITEEQLTTLLTAAILAPSGGNRQPWYFYAVRDKETRQRLSEAAGGQEFVAQAPVVIVVCVDPDRSRERYGDRGAGLYCFQDTAAAVQNILLVATDMGLGTCWVGAFDEDAASQVLDIPTHLRPVAMVPVGHPERQPKPRPRRGLEEVVKYI